MSKVEVLIILRNFYLWGHKRDAHHSIRFANRKTEMNIVQTNALRRDNQETPHVENKLLSQVQYLTS